MKFFSFFNKKEVREEPNTSQSYTYEDALEHQSYCSMVQKQDDFLKRLFEHYKYDDLSISTVFACINIISNNMAKIPWELKQNGKVIDKKYLDNLLKESNLTSFMMIKQVIQDVLMHGNGFIYVIRDKNTAKVKGLRYLRPDQVTIFYDELKDRVLYQAPIVKKSQFIEPINMLHFLMNSKNGVEGIGVLQYAHNTIELAGYTNKAAHDYFKNGMAVQGIIKSPIDITDKRREQIRKGWNATNGNIRILEGGLSYETVQSTSKEAELASQRTQNAIEICRTFNVSPVLVGILDHIVYGSVEHAQMDLVQNTLSAYITMIEKEVNRKLLLPTEKSYEIDLYEDALIKPDKESFISSLTTLVDKAVMTRNEARQELGLPVIDDEFANSLSLTYKDNESKYPEKDPDTENEA